MKTGHCDAGVSCQVPLHASLVSSGKSQEPELVSVSLSTLQLQWCKGPGGQGPGSTSLYNAPKLIMYTEGPAVVRASLWGDQKEAHQRTPIFAVQAGIKQEATEGRILQGFRRGVGADNSEHSLVETELRVAAGRRAARSRPLTVLEPSLPALAGTASAVLNH